MKKQSKRIITAVIATVLSAVGMMGMTVSADAVDNSSDNVMGDVNADGKFTIADVTLFQSWIMGNDVTLNNYQVVDFCQDGILDVFDLCMMKSELLTYNSSEEYPVKNPVVIDEFTPCTDTIEDNFVGYMVEVTIKQQYSDINKIWTIEDFKNVENMEYIINATPASSSRQILYIMLKNCGKENVLKMINDIESLQLEEIMKVSTSSPLGLPEPLEK